MTLLTFNAIPPTKQAQLVDAYRYITVRWQSWVDVVGKRMAAVRILDTPYDPPSIAAGAAETINVTMSGIAPGDFAQASFDQPNVAIRLLADVTAVDTVTVTFLNLSGASVDLASGTLRVRVENKP
jgi:hypothetical protein